MRPGQARGSDRSTLWIAGILAAAAAIRFATLDAQSFQHDEAVTAHRVILAGLGETMSAVGEGERSPPLYYLLAWLWSQPFGTGEVGLRSLSALFGTLTVAVAYLIGRDALPGRRVGLLAAAFVALNPYLVWYSQEARPYALLVLLSALGLLYFLRSVEAPTRRNAALWSLFSALALNTHYFAGFLIAPQALWLLFVHRRVATIPVGVAAVVVCAAALLPLALSQQGEDRRDAFTDVPLPERVAETGLDFFAGDEPDPFAGDQRIDAVQIGAGIAGLALIVAGGMLLARRATTSERRSAKLVGAVALAGIGVPVLAAALGILDLVRPRNVIAILVPILVVLALAFGGLRARRAGRVGAAGLLAVFASVLGAIAVSEQMQRENWRGIAEPIGPAEEPRLIYGAASLALDSASTGGGGSVRPGVRPSTPARRTPCERISSNVPQRTKVTPAVSPVSSNRTV